MKAHRTFACLTCICFAATMITGMKRKRKIDKVKEVLE